MSANALEANIEKVKLSHIGALIFLQQVRLADQVGFRRIIENQFHLCNTVIVPNAREANTCTRIDIKDHIRQSLMV